MINKCKKCGCDALIKDGEWYECPACGAMMLDISVFVGDMESPTKALEILDSGGTIDEIKPVKKQEAFSFAAPPKDAEPMSLTADENSKSTDNRLFEAADEEAAAHKNAKKVKKERKQTKKKEKEYTSADSEEESEADSSGNRLKEGIQFCIPIVIALIVAILLKTLIFANAVVPTGSMISTINKGDRIVASRLSYINEDPQRYDIIIFKYPDDETQYYVKRIVGLPGETIQVIDGTVYVTGSDGETTELDDSFVKNGTPTGDFGPYTIPLGSYFVMGDNRNNSWDSRYWDNKTVYRDKIIGKVKFRYFPNPSKIE